MFKCLRPRKVYNKYIGRDIICHCGKCEMCVSDRAAHYSNLTNTMSHQYKYCMFVTLTYAPKYLPGARAEVEYVPEEVIHFDKLKLPVKVIPAKYIYSFYSTCERLDEDGLLLAEYESKDLKELKDLEERMQLGFNQFAYCSTKDIQMFHKRFLGNMKNRARSYYKRFIKFGTYNKDFINEICSYKHFSTFDYGGTRLRPHYHMLFFFNSEFFLKNFRKVLCTSWKYGIYNCSLSRGGAETYCAQYVNSMVIVPEILKTGKFKVKQTHSIGFYQSLFKGCKQDIYEYDHRKTLRDGVKVGKKDDTVRLEGYVSSIVFPKCINLSRSTHDELYQIFTVFRRAVQYCSMHPERGQYNLSHVSDMARLLSYDCFDGECNYKFINFLRSLGHVFDGVTRKQLEDFLYRLLLTSKRFFEFLDEDSHEFLESSENLINLRIRQIYDWYYCKSMFQLEKWYEDMDEKLNDSALWLTVLYMFDNFVNRYCRIPISLFEDGKKNKFFDFIEKIPLYHIDIGTISRLNDIEFRNRWSNAQFRLMKYIKHKELVHCHY